MLFQKRYWNGIQSGDVTMTFRRWRSRQVVAGRRYRTPAGMIEVEAVEDVGVESITDEQARRCGHPDVAALLADLSLRHEPERGGVPLYRIQFHCVDEPDPRDTLAATSALTPEEIAELARHLERLDRRSGHGPWTSATIQIIEDRPCVRAADLAADLGRETKAFKLDVRKLKALGLTISLRTGYRLSPRGVAYWRHINGVP